MGVNRMKAWRLALTILATALAGAAAPIQPALARPAAVAAARIPFTQAEATGVDGGAAFLLAWAAPAGAGPVRVFARTSPGADGPARLVGHGGATGHIKVSGLPPADRWYFDLKPAHGADLVTADRALHLATAPNFRDVGGYRTADGRWVRMGLVYRSDQLDRLSDADLARIGRLSPALVVDLRTEAERKRGPDRLPPGAAPMIADVAADAPPSGGISRISSPNDAADFLIRANQQFVALPSAKDAYTRLFAKLQSEGGPDVYHCSAGKDRTGWATAVLLTALSVPRETVMADYLASNGYLVEKNRAMFSAMPARQAANLEPVFTVRAAYLNAAFDEVDKRYGSFDRYLKEGLGLDDAALARLKARFLAGAPAS
jgi:protein-tyrosine phosphatase